MPIEKKIIKQYATKKMFKVGFFFFLALFFCTPLRSQTPIWVDNMPFSPSFFGPNSLPIPDFLNGEIDSLSSFQMAYDTYWGKPDKTINLFVRIDFVAISKRLQFSVWMVPYEYYWINARSATDRNLNPTSLIGGGTGDVYVATYLSILKERQFLPNIIVGAAIKTASGGNVMAARFHDTPGYFFDLVIGKNKRISPNFSLNYSLTAGFLCWQTSQFRQNDAVMLGAKLIFLYKKMEFSNELGAYMGWQKNGDFPITYKSVFAYQHKKFKYFIKYQIGIQDFPYQQIRFGASFLFDASYKKK